MAGLKLEIVPGEFTVHRLQPDESGATEALRHPPAWVARTAEELSVVCRSDVPVRSSRVETGWSCLKICGPLDMDEVGVLAETSAALASAGIALLALSTFDTDYVLVRSRNLAGAIECLTRAGHDVVHARPA